MIRQFEIQRSSIEQLVHDYLLDESDEDVSVNI